MKDDLLKEGPREAPEPLTAEERTDRKGVKAAGGGIAAGGLGLAKAGFLGKFLIYLFLWNGIRTGFLVGGWIGIVLVVAVVGAFVYYRKQRRATA